MCKLRPYNIFSKPQARSSVLCATRLLAAHPRAQRALRLRVSAYSEWKDTVETAALVAAASAVIITTATLVDTPVERKLRKLQRNSSDFDDDDNFKWGVIGVLSCLPLINWTGWVFAALESEVPALYYSYAALYSLPFLLEGFEFGSFTILMLAIGAMHAQAQRILVTEPDTRLELPSAAQVLQPLFESLQASVRRLPRAVEAAKRLEEAERSELDLEDLREDAARQLRNFDQEMKQRRSGDSGSSKRERK